MKPKKWGEMTPEEKGALLLAHHEGKEIQFLSSYRGWEEAEPRWSAWLPYRVKPEPKRETVTLLTAHYFGWVAEPPQYRGDSDTHRITFDLIDGEPDCTSIRMEKIK